MTALEPIQDTYTHAHASVHTGVLVSSVTCDLGVFVFTTENKGLHHGRQLHLQ